MTDSEKASRTEELREDRWWWLFGTIHAPRGSELRKKFEREFVELSQKIEREKQNNP